MDVRWSETERIEMQQEKLQGILYHGPAARYNTSCIREEYQSNSTLYTVESNSLDFTHRLIPPLCPLLLPALEPVSSVIIQ